MARPEAMLYPVPGDAGPSTGSRVAVVLYVVPGIDRSMLVPGLRPTRRQVTLEGFRFLDDAGTVLEHDLEAPITVSSDEQVERIVNVVEPPAGSSRVVLEALTAGSSRWRELGSVVLDPSG